MQKLDGKTFNVVQDNIEKLKQLFPEVFTENKIDFEKLMLTLGEHVEKEKERYEFTWNGKTKAIQLAQKQTTGTLRPCKEESLNWGTTKNLYIEGDNLEVLRVLQNSYRNKVKMIYIDPPYNTGKDFVYKDDFHDNIKNYKEKNQENLKSNPETSGRYHTDWLNMIYPRLKVAKSLLMEDGVIFISIDDNEHANLKKICDEIFGEENLLANFVWRRTDNQANIGFIAKVKEYILCYAKNRSYEGFKLNKLPLSDKAKKEYSYKDEVGFFRRRNILDKSRGKKFYKIVSPNGDILEGPWMIDEDEFKQLDSEGKIYWASNKMPYGKKYLHEAEGQIINDWLTKDFGTNQRGSNEINDLFKKRVFDFVKPISLIKTFIQISTQNNDIIMDFFSGSSTTSHAVMEQNAEDSGNRRFIMVQLPEPTDEKSDAYKAGYKNICEIGKERIRRAGQKILEENKGKEGIENLDIGFKVFKLDDTNLKVWDEDSADLERDLLDLINPIKEGRTQEDVVYEILLKYGIDLTVPIEETKVADKVVYSVGMGYLLICLERDLTLEHIEEIAKQKPARVVFYDEGFKDDTVRINAQQILKRYGVEDIRVI
jgi:adenine-specific DNA-methyltransferase